MSIIYNKPLGYEMGNLPQRHIEGKFSLQFVFPLKSIRIKLDLTAVPPRFQAVSVLQQAVVLADPRDTNHRSVTIIYSVDIGCHAKTLNTADRCHAWQRYATDVRSLGGIAKEGLAWGESHILDRRFSFQ
jgi:hypothetical protein